MYKCTFVFGLLCALASQQAHAAVTTFNDLVAFQNALSPGASSVVETFDTETPVNTVLNFNTFTSTATPSLTAPPLVNGAHSVNEFGQLRIDVDFETNDATRPGRVTSVVWTFDTPIFALGFDAFAVNVASLGGALLNVDDGDGLQSFLLHDILDQGGLVTSGFIGIIATNSITSIEFTGAPGEGSSDAFNVDNVQTAVAAVPLPYALPLLASAFGILLGLKRQSFCKRAGS